MPKPERSTNAYGVGGCETHVWGLGASMRPKNLCGEWCSRKKSAGNRRFQREISGLLCKITVLEAENATLKTHLNTLGGVVATLVDQINIAGNKFQELSSQGGLVAGRLQGVEFGVGHAVDRLAIEQSELRGQLNWLFKATKPEVAPPPRSR